MQLGLLLLLIHCIFVTTALYNNIYDYACETNSNCTQLLANSICFNKKCICQFGYVSNGCRLEENRVRNRRQTTYGMRMLGEECDWTNQCRQTPVDGTRVCLARKCQCSHGYVPIDAYRCIQDFEPLSSDMPVTNSYDNGPPGYGSICSTNSDCQQATTHLQCNQGLCACLDGYVPLGKYLCYNILGQSTSIIKSSTIISTPLSTTSIYNPIGNDALKSLGKIGNSCTNDYFCRRAVSQSHCYNGKCACFNGYTSIDQYTCMKTIDQETTTKIIPIPVDFKSLLGGRCLTKRNCHTSNAICQNSICACPKGYFPVDDWTCLQEPESSDEELIETTSIITKAKTTTTTLSTSTAFRWWPWSPTPTTRQTYTTLKNTFRVRCLLNRQCASMDKNSHCTLFGRCICNPGYELKTTNRGQRCTSRITNDDDCD